MRKSWISKQKQKTCNWPTTLKSKSSYKNLSYYNTNRKNPTSTSKKTANLPNKEKTITSKTGWKTWKKINRNSRSNWLRMRKSTYKKHKILKRITGKRNSTWTRKTKAICLNCKESTKANWKRWNKNSNSSSEFRSIN